MGRVTGQRHQDNRDRQEKGDRVFGFGKIQTQVGEGKCAPVVPVAVERHSIRDLPRAGASIEEEATTGP